MPDGYRIQIKGLDRLQKILKDAPANLVKEVDAIFEDAAKQFVGRAKRDSPKDTGFNAGAITHKKNSSLSYQVSAQQRYAGFLEFGTGKNYRAIPGFEQVASELKGMKIGGTYKEGLDNITQWCRRKGIRINGATLEGTAYVIFNAILRNGIKPRPYFFKQVEPARQQIDRDLKNIEKIFD